MNGVPALLCRINQFQKQLPVDMTTAAERAHLSRLLQLGFNRIREHFVASCIHRRRRVLDGRC